MRKLLLLLPVFCMFSGLANAKCTLLSCGQKDGINGWITADVGGNQCWFCGPGPNSCGNGDVVPYIDGEGSIIGLSVCSSGIVSSFYDYSPGQFCNGSDLSSRNGTAGISLEHAKKTFAISGEESRAYSLGDLEAFIGKASCIMVKCDEGYMPNADKTACVLDDRESVCTNSGGTWANQRCSCSASKNLILSGDKCVCKSDSYVFDSAKKRCDLKPELAAAENNKKKCVDSGGSWVGGRCVCDADKNLKLSGVQCICTSDDYKWNSAQKMCVMTNSAACSRVEGAYWDEVLQKCLCSQRDFVISGNKCILNPRIEECNKVSDAEWSGDDCVCKDRKKVVDFDKLMCVDSAETIAQQQAEQQQQEQDASMAKIRTIVAGLDTKKDQLLSKLSVWKDEDGQFNTSRLVSDSVAGVVLGTAGGLITSNVVKKSQVKNGFEDLNCTIGGQVVAGWGDEFLVGIQ